MPNIVLVISFCCFGCPADGLYSSGWGYYPSGAGAFSSSSCSSLPERTTRSVEKIR